MGLILRSTQIFNTTNLVVEKFGIFLPTGFGKLEKTKISILILKNTSKNDSEVANIESADFHSYFVEVLIHLWACK
jgi:hypothetical protein